MHNAHLTMQELGKFDRIPNKCHTKWIKKICEL